MSLVIPLQHIQLVEKADTNTTYKGLLITTLDSSFLFAQIPDRDFLVSKVSELISKSFLNQKSQQLQTHLRETSISSSEAQGILCLKITSKRFHEIAYRKFFQKPGQFRGR